MSIPFTSLEEMWAYGTELKLFLPEMGDLQKHLCQGEYGLFKYIPLFESNFVQVTKRGEMVNIYNKEPLVTLGIAATSPVLPLPNIMLVARPLCDPCNNKTSHRNKLQLSRLFPLKFVKITIYDTEQRQLKIKLASGRAFHVQLNASPEKVDDLFKRWVKLINLLRPPPPESETEYSQDLRPVSSSSVEPSKMELSMEREEEEEEQQLEEAIIEKEEEDYPAKNEQAVEEKQTVETEIAIEEKQVQDESTKEKAVLASENKELPKIQKKPRKNVDAKRTPKKSKQKSSRTKPEATQSVVVRKESKLANLLRTLSKHGSPELSKSATKDKERPKKKKK
uniref:Protein FAM71E1 n=1 Tax=Geotrypetes seraphini TaxID=260995 RepID=A0A6P8SGK9_GEOSA|nr:protein FAM71E1 [Geotrypetes seraphini]XP_033817543.1 protein FAM71E1 [Geotrypetes seraphini]XP_033817544.1 protein FAM71E1 [Geotrypetes seraphini]